MARKDKMGWHADDEDDVLPLAPILSFSLGAARDFQFRPAQVVRQNTTVRLEHGSCLSMLGTLQETHEHSLPVRKRVSGPRFNATVRCMRVQLP